MHSSCRSIFKFIYNIRVFSFRNFIWFCFASINSIDNLSKNRNDLLEYFAKNKEVSAFSRDQVSEEQKKAKIITKDTKFAQTIYEAENHPYFSGQIRSALYISESANGYDEKNFSKYWAKISALFDENKLKYGHLTRQALLTFNDYTITVAYNYKTLCVDDPKESHSNPSMKRLFSDHNDKIKEFLDTIWDVNNIEKELKNMVINSKVAKNDWRYCFINNIELFISYWINQDYLRLREVDGRMIIVPKITSSGYTRDIFLEALFLEVKNDFCIDKIYWQGERGTDVEHYLELDRHLIMFKNGKYIIEDQEEEKIYETTTNDPLGEILNSGTLK